MKRIFIITITLIMLIANFNLNIKAAEANPPEIPADSAVLMDASTGDILYGKNIDSAYPPASTTKIMTALLTLEKTNLDDEVTISNDFTNKNFKLIDGNTICIKNGEQLKVRDLLYALLLRSANDAAVALAEHISGSVPEFANLMNKRAEELGCKTAHFANPNGLYNPDHKVSAKDLALILRELSTHEEFVKIATTLSYTIPPTNKTDATETAKNRVLNNENKLIYKGSSNYYEGVEGGKTGYTTQSLFSYVACATRNGHRLIVTFVHSKDRTYFEDARKLFDYGFQNFDTIKLYSKGDKVLDFTNSSNVKIPLLAGKDFYYIIKKGSDLKPSINFHDNYLKSKKFNKGETVSSVNVVMDGKSLGTLPLISGGANNLTIFSSAPSSTNNYKYLGVAAAFIIAAIGLRQRKKLRLRRKQKMLFKDDELR